MDNLDSICNYLHEFEGLFTLIAVVLVLNLFMAIFRFISWFIDEAEKTREKQYKDFEKRYTKEHKE